MLTFFHEVMQPDSNGAIALLKPRCPNKSHLIDPANKERCRISFLIREGEQSPDRSGTNVWSSSCFLFFDDSVGEWRPARWHEMISSFTEENLHTFSGFLGWCVEFPSEWKQEQENLHLSQRAKGNPALKFIQHASYSILLRLPYILQYMLPTAFKNNMCGFGLLAWSN